MGASRTLLRKTKMDQARRQRPENRAVKRGTFERRVTTVRSPSAAAPYEVTFHATKGWRSRRVAV